jgi:hypothetical protein
MKSLINLLMATLLLTVTYNSLNAQLGLGIRGGVNFATAEFREKIEGSWETSNKDLIPGINANFLAEIGFSEKFAFQPEVSFIQKGYKTTLTDDTEHKVTLNYIEAPILLKGKFGSGAAKFTMVLGPTVAYAFNGKIKSGDSEADIDFDASETKQFEIGAMFGIGLDLKAGPGSLFLDSRLGWSMNNLDNSDASDDFRWHNRNVSFGAGYIYRFGW